MTILKLIFKNLTYRPLGTMLSILLLAFGVGIISMMVLVQRQLESKFENDLRHIDMVLGAKGSPLQLVLSAVYHVDAPTGNVPLKEVETIAKNPMVKHIIPLAYGDSWRGFRIVGTDTSYISKYDGVLASGRLFQEDLEMVVGANVAERLQAQVGQTFVGTHGEAEAGEQHDQHPYRIVGILKPTYSVLDNLVLTKVSTVWATHEHPAEAADGASATHEEAHHDHEAEEDDREVTAALVQFKSPMGIMTLPRIVNSTTSMQSAVPALEINRLMKLMGIGVTTLQGLAIAIMLISGLSVFISLFSRLKDRKYELALLRSMGCSRTGLFMILIGEGLLLAIIGFVTGWLFSRLGLWWLNGSAAKDFHLQFNWYPTADEWIILLITIVIGKLAAFIPAVKAFRLNISRTLAEN